MPISIFKIFGLLALLLSGSQGNIYINQIYKANEYQRFYNQFDFLKNENCRKIVVSDFYKKLKNSESEKRIVHSQAIDELEEILQKEVVYDFDHSELAINALNKYMSCRWEEERQCGDS